MAPPDTDKLSNLLKEAREKAPLWLLLGTVSSSLLSIAVSQILLAAAYFAYGWQWKKGLTRFEPWRPVLLPLLLYLLWGLIAAAFAPDPMLALKANRKIFLYAVLFLTPAVVRKGNEHAAILHAIFAAAAIAALDGLTQYVMQPQRDLLHRISGFMSIWMTYAGLLMLALVALVGYSLRTRKIKLWLCLLGLIIVTALLLSKTRNAWMGSAAGVTVVLILRKPRALLLLLPLMVGMFLFSPEAIKQRVRSTMDPNDDNTRNRIELVGTSLRLIRDNPWVGVGPENVAQEALRYRGTTEFPNFMYQHMHNNFLQVASERGLPGLFLWLWFMGRLGWDSATVYRRNRGHSASDPESEFAVMVSSIAIGALVALLVAGLAEWNFNDSEVLVLFMFLVAAPYTYLQKSAGTRIPAAARTGI